ncbi:multiheme c-type cytochrome [Arthrobacter sp. AB6]|uniref:multiheme c-type cytochrome n=1 Tax=Arthrobacter sp. AB6 TaxID=2962570 RepID=UPI0037BFE106
MSWAWWTCPTAKRSCRCCGTPQKSATSHLSEARRPAPRRPLTWPPGKWLAMQPNHTATSWTPAEPSSAWQHTPGREHTQGCTSCGVPSAYLNGWPRNWPAA